MARSHLMLLLLCVGALLARPIPSGDTALSASSSELSQDAVSFLQYEAATPAALQPHEVGLLLKKLLSKSSEKQDEDEDPDADEGEEGEGGPDVCDKEVQKMFFDEIDKDDSGEVTEEELLKFVHDNCDDVSDQEAKDAFEHMMDANGDGKVSLDEFENFLDTVEGCNAKARTNLKAHTGGNGKKVLKKKIKALEKRTDARRRRMANQHAKKKIKKKIKATEKVTDAKERKDHAAEKKAEHEEGDDGAVSFLQYEAATPAVLQPHEASVLFKKLLSKASEDDEGEDDEGEEDVCDKEVQKGFFDEIDADQSGEISKEELIDFAEGMCEEDGEPAEDCAEDAEHLYDMLDTNGDGEVSLDEFETFLDNMFGCGCNGKARTNLKAHTGGNGKKKLKKKLKAMEKKAEARRKQTVNQHAKKVIKKKIKASEKVAEAKERAHAAAARKAAKEQEDGDDDGKAM